MSFSRARTLWRACMVLPAGALTGVLVSGLSPPTAAMPRACAQRRRLAVLLACGWLGAISASKPQAAAQSAAPAPRVQQANDGPAVHGAVVAKYCVSCHNSRTRTADLAFDSLDLATVA